MRLSELIYDLYQFDPLKFDILINPDKYAQCIPSYKIISDNKVSVQGVMRYEAMIDRGEDPGTLVLIKHRKKDLYAVLDGHHKYCALKNKGLEEMKAAVIPDRLFGFLFYLTRKGKLQPSAKFTQDVRIPFLVVVRRIHDLVYGESESED